MNISLHKKEIKQLYNNIKSSAKKRNIPFDLTLSDLNNLSFPITCPILGMPLYFHRDKPQDDSYSFDRIDSSFGYTIDNIVVISHRANRLKSDVTPDELRALFEYYCE
jgi:hypothetical protein